jgi:hypothetical protein
MSGHWRFCVTAFLLVAGLLTSPASSNPLTDLFNVAPKEAAAPAPAQEECLLQPGRSAAPGQHWVYHHDGRRKCWFQADGATVTVKSQIHHHAPKRRAIAPEENEVAAPQKTVLDARAQLLSAAPAPTPQSTASAPEAVDTLSVPTPGAATPVPTAPIAAQPTTDQLTPDRVTPRSVDVEMLMTASTLDQDMAASSVPQTTPVAPSVAGANDWEFTTARVGTALIALGFVLLLGSLLASRFFGSRETPIRRA